MRSEKNKCDILLLLLCVSAITNQCSAQQIAPEDPEYVRVTNDRAEKIVAKLAPIDADKALRVRDLVAGFYRDLHSVHADRDVKLKRAEPNESPVSVRADCELRQFRLHYAFTAKLAAELGADQMDQIKNGLTYDVVPKTYQQYLNLYPNLTPEQQRSILGFLFEAREHAMDAGSSEEKHAVFGKYKGRINNLLSAAGFDAKQAEREWKARQEKLPQKN
jgi:hypothetical protein